MITLIVARARNGAIGKENTIPWYIPTDLAFFKRETEGAACIMGRNTWESLPFKPLPRRMNIVVSSDESLTEHVCPSIEDAIARARDHGHSRIYGMGGARIYQEMLPIAERLLISEVDLTIEDADTFFPKIDETWREIGQLPLNDSPSCIVHEYLRR